MLDKRIFLFIFLSLFLFLSLSSVSAVQKQYDASTQTVKLNDNFLIFNTGDIATVQLKTPLVNHVGLGYQEIAELQINGFKNYGDFISGFNFYDLKNKGAQINRNIDIKVKQTQEVLIPEYSTTIKSYNQNGTANYQVSQTGSHYENKTVWKNLSPLDLKNGDSLTIGFFTNVGMDEKIEWIPTIANLKITEWAVYYSGAIKTYRDIGGVNYTILTYLNSGTLNLTSNTNVSYLVVAGGGGGGAIPGAYHAPGGGGAGGLNTSQSGFTIPSGNYIVTVGQGGHGGYINQTQGTQGGNSSIGSLIKTQGGGLGGGYYGGEVEATAGGSGGGAINSVPGSGIAGQGNNGGDGITNGGGGGGGAGAVGSNGDGTNGGAGGAGIGSNIYNGTTLYYSGGGGGGSRSGSAGAGGVGGGGAAGTGTNGGQNATANTGGGGGATGASVSSIVWDGGNGGSGIVIVRFETEGLLVHLNSPTNYTNFSTQSVTFNATIESQTLDLINVSLLIDGSINETNTSGINGEYLFNKVIADGEHNWGIFACDTSAGCFNATPLNFSIDTTSPVIGISFPSGTYTYLHQDTNLTLNFTANDTHLGNCLWEYNGSNKSVACTNGVLATNYFNYSINKNNGTLYANDTLGHYSSAFTSWDYKILELNKTYNSETTEGSFENFSLFMTKASGINVQNVVLYYDGSNDTSSIYSSGDQVRATSELFIPNVGADTNNTFYFTVTLSDGTVFNTTTATQLVTNIEIDDCSSQPDLFLNLTLLDEGNQSAITGNIEVYLGILNSANYEEVLNFSASYTGVTGKTFCSSQLLNETEFLLTATVRYDSSNHSAEFYNIQRSALYAYPKVYYLYDLADEDTTRFKVTYRGDNLIGVEGAIIQLQRQYVGEGGAYKIVEAPLTSSDSSAVLHIDTDTHSYKATVVKNGVLLNTFDNLVFICQSELTGECTLDLSSFIVPPNSVNIYVLHDFTYSISTSVSNQTITLSYSVPSGTTSTVRVLANQTDIVGTDTICDSTVSSAAGSIECNYNTSIEDSVINYNVYKDGELVAQTAYVVQDDLRDDFGGANYFILIIFALSLTFMAILSPEWIVLNSIIVVIAGAAIWLIRGMNFVLGLGAVAWLILAAVIILLKQSQKEDQ